MNHKDYMAMCLDLARLGTGRTSPNPMVGAVLVRDGKVVATGWHHGPGKPHAEIEALTPPLNVRGGRGVLKSTLYVNLEPCCHHGRTPPCTDAIIQRGIRHVVVGIRDPDSRVAGHGIRKLRAAGLQVEVGIMERECRQLNEPYLKHRQTGLPFVILKAAATLDGKLADARGHSKWITGPEARQYVHTLRDEVDAILVGSRTVRQDNPRLTARLPNGKGQDPLRIILDSALSLPLTSQIFKLHSKAPTLVATTAQYSPQKKAALERLGVEVLVCRTNRQRQVDLPDLLKKLGARGILSILVEGGATVHSCFVQQKLADKLSLFLAPKIMGEGLPLFNGLRRGGVKKMLQVQSLTSRLVGPDLLIEGYFRQPN